jgi:hypothetical protein
VGQRIDWVGKSGEGGKGEIILIRYINDVTIREGVVCSLGYLGFLYLVFCICFDVCFYYLQHRYVF